MATKKVPDPNQDLGKNPSYVSMVGRLSVTSCILQVPLPDILPYPSKTFEFGDC